MTAAFTILLGVGVGLALGALGGGGSTLAVPILVFIAGLTPQEATTASLLVVGVAAAVGAIEHVRRGNVRLGLGLVFGIAGIAGSRIGSSINRMIDGDVLLAGFAVLIVFVALRMYRAAAPAATPGPPDEEAKAIEGTTSAVADPRDLGGARVTVDAPAPAPTVAARPVPVHLSSGQTLVRLIVAATTVGLLTGLFGVGGGFVIVPALVLVLGFEPRQAIGTSLVVIAVNAMIALGMRAGEIDIDWSIIGPFLATVTVGVVAGTALASRVAADRLTRSFAVMLAAIGAYTLIAAVA